MIPFSDLTSYNALHMYRFDSFYSSIVLQIKMMKKIHISIRRAIKFMKTVLNSKCPSFRNHIITGTLI